MLPSILAKQLKAGGAVAVCAVLNDEKDRRTDKYEQEWNGLWRFYNVMQFSDEFIAVSSVGIALYFYGDGKMNNKCILQIYQDGTWNN